MGILLLASIDWHRLFLLKLDKLFRCLVEPMMIVLRHNRSIALVVVVLFENVVNQLVIISEREHLLVVVSSIVVVAFGEFMASGFFSEIAFRGLLRLLLQLLKGWLLHKFSNRILLLKNSRLFNQHLFFNGDSHIPL